MSSALLLVLTGGSNFDIPQGQLLYEATVGLLVSNVEIIHAIAILCTIRPAMTVLHDPNSKIFLLVIQIYNI